MDEVASERLDSDPQDIVRFTNAKQPRNEAVLSPERNSDVCMLILTYSAQHDLGLQLMAFVRLPSLEPGHGGLHSIAELFELGVFRMVSGQQAFHNWV